MDFSLLFQILNGIAMIAWLPLFFIPKNKILIWFLRSRIVPSFFAILYVILLTWILLESKSSTLDFSFEGIKQLFGDDKAIILGWLHYLAFDLMTGIYIVEDSEKRKIPHLFIAPCLFFTFILGPVGWLIYWVLRLKYPIKSK